MSKKQIVVGVAAHKPYRMPSDPAYLPLHVGAALHPEVNLGDEFQRDDEGDNISRLNGSYSELTGLYWLWKNCDADYKGLVHYRRLLGSDNRARHHAKDPFDRVATGDELIAAAENTGVVVAKRRNYYIETVHNHYAHTFDIDHFDVCREVLSYLYPDYVKAWDRLMQSRGAHILNMFVMRDDLFDAYCEWLFSILDELTKRIISTDMDSFQARWPGRVSERLLDPWLWTNGIEVAELPVVSPEPVDWVSKGKGFLAAKFLGRKYEKSF